MWYAIAYTHKGDRGRVGIRQQTMNATIANNNKIDLLVLLTTRQLLNQGFTMAKLKSDNCDSFTVITMNWLFVIGLSIILNYHGRVAFVVNAIRFLPY